MPLTAVLEPGGDLSTLLYVLAFSLFIIGIKQGTSPTTAKRGNLIAAVGMAIAVVTTLLLDGIGNWGVIVGGFMVTDRMLGMFSRKKPAKRDDSEPGS